MTKQYIVRNVRMNTDLDNRIREIAEREDRTISNVIQRLLESAITSYDLFGIIVNFEQCNPHDLGLTPEETKTEKAVLITRL